MLSLCSAYKDGLIIVAAHGPAQHQRDQAGELNQPSISWVIFVAGPAPRNKPAPGHIRPIAGWATEKREESI